MANERVLGSYLLDEHVEHEMKSRKITASAVAAELGVGLPTLYHWRIGSWRPRQAMQQEIEVWSGGKVPVLSWLTTKERLRRERLERRAA